MVEICHGIAPVPQPSPARNDGGDCFACATTAALRWMFPDADVDFDAVWECFIAEYHDGNAQANLGKLRDAVARVVVPPFEPADLLEGMQDLTRVYDEVSAAKPNTTVSNTWGEHGLGKALKRAAEKFGGEWGAIEIEYDILRPQFEIRTWSHAWFGSEPVSEWAKALERWLGAGYVAFSEQNYNGDGQMTADHMLRSTDHITLIDGVRYGWGEWKDGGRGQEFHAHVVCSTGRGAYWIPVHDLMRKHGVAGLIFARRSRI